MRPACRAESEATVTILDGAEATSLGRRASVSTAWGQVVHGDHLAKALGRDPLREGMYPRDVGKRVDPWIPGIDLLTSAANLAQTRHIGEEEVDLGFGSRGFDLLSQPTGLIGASGNNC